jgi:hypothetical protein
MTPESAARPIRNIQPIQLSQGQEVRQMADLERFVEGPALPACQDLYDKNIKTISASANQKDANGLAYIDVDYDTLSDENKRIAAENGEIMTYMIGEAAQPIEDQPKAVKLAVPVTPEDTEETVASKLFELSERLQPQDLRWAPTYSLADLKKVYGYDSEEPVNLEDFVGEGYYYDPNSKLFHLSEELFRKSQETISS